jgi:uncharacterized protein (TIGR02453 family)
MAGSTPGQDAYPQLRLALAYLSGLEANNDREWYSTHKAERLAAEEQFEKLVAVIQRGAERFAPGTAGHAPESLTFRLQRDTRFAKDKSPYNPAFRAHLGPSGKLPIPCGPFVSLRPGDKSILGGGLFAAMFADATRSVRDAITASPDRWLEVVESLNQPVLGEALKNPPRGYPADHPCGEWLKHKSWYVEVPVADADLLEPEFSATATEVFEQMQPLNDFLNQALDGFQMPTR